MPACSNGSGSTTTPGGPLLDAYGKDRTSTGNELVELGRRIGQAQVVHTPPWLEMTPTDFEVWTADTLSGTANFLYASSRQQG